MKRFGLALLLAALAWPAVAQSGHGMTLEDYRQAFNTPATEETVDWTVYATAYIEGFGNGLLLSNGLLAVQGRAPALCVPKGLTLNFKNFKRMIDNQIEESSKTETLKNDLTVETVLIAAMDKAFRCPEKPLTRQ